MQRQIKFRLKEIMESRSLTQKQLSQAAGVGRFAVRQFQRGTVQLVDVATLSRICNYLEIEIQDLMYLE